MSTTETVWKFTEVNDWEGETWTRFFTGTKELDSKLKKLSKLLTKKDYCPYTLEVIDSMPISFYEGTEGYYAVEQEMETPNTNQVESAIKFWSKKESDEQDPLYKLGLFD